jgi:N-acetylneuraminate synthase
MTRNEDSYVYIIAEAGVNHNGNFDLALKMIEVAAEAGADAVKFQTFSAIKLANSRAPKADYQKRTTNSEESQLEMLQKLELSHECHYELKEHAQKHGITFLSSAFDEESLDFLNNLNLPLFKIPSGEITNAPLLWKFAKTGKPLILSTGMATIGEVEVALAIFTHALNNNNQPGSLNEVWLSWCNIAHRKALKNHVTLLHCTSQYPTPYDEANLRSMVTLKSTFNLDIGYSDHTEGTLVPVAAVAMGATVIEKHFTLDKNLNGPDHMASLDPEELKSMISDIRILQKILGSGIKAPQIHEWQTRLAARQQLVAITTIQHGQLFTPQNLGTSRAEVGTSPIHYWDMLGKTAKRSYKAGDAILE